MAFKGLMEFKKRLQEKDDLVTINDFVDPVLEITEVTDRISKQPGG